MTDDIDAIREYTVSADTLDVPPARRATDSRTGEDTLVETVSGLLDRNGTTGGNRVVGLGETTHGTRGCFRLKTGLVGLLVREFGVRTVAFEADTSAACALDAYVRRGEGDPETALAGLEKWMWRVESVRDLLVWLRSFNQGRPPADRVSVRGVDLSRPAAPADSLRSYFERVDPLFVEDGPLARLAAVEVPGSGSAGKRALDEAVAAARDIEEQLLDRKEAYVDMAGRRAWARAKHLCRVVEQTCDWSRVRYETAGPNPEGMARRDRYMAANVGWCVEQDPNGRVAVWAHNSHVKRGTFDDGQVWTDAVTMGEQLAREFGDRYTPVGFDVGRGRFRAVKAGATDGGPRQFAFEAPVDGSMTARFDAVGDSPWLLDVQAAASDPRLRDWFDTPQRIRWVGTVYDPDAPEQQYLRTPLTGFDALLFLDRSTPSRPVGARSDSEDR